MRNTENRIMQVCAWGHAVVIFSGLYLLIPSLSLDFSKSNLENILQSGILFVPVIASYYLSRYLKRLILYLAASSAITFAMYAVSGSILTTICSALICLMRCRSKIERGRIRRQMREYPGGEGRFCEPEDWEIPSALDRPHPAFWIIFIIEYFVLIFSGQFKYLKGIFYLLLAEIVFCFVCSFVENMKSFILTRQKIANLPTRMILKNGYSIFAVMAAALFVMVMPSILYNKEPLTGLYHEPHNITSYEIYLEEMNGPEEGSSDWAELLTGEETAPPAWMEALSQFLIWGCTILVAFFGARIMIKAIRNMADSFAENEEDEVINLKLMDEQQKAWKRTQRKKDRKLHGTIDYRIRRRYKKTILKGMQNKPSGAESPDELEKKARLVNLREREQMHRIYEKARYSPAHCTEEDEQNFPV